MKIICREHIYEKITAPSCHASTVLKLKDGTLLAAWFAGEKEGAPDVTVWYSRKVDGAWEAPKPAVPNVGVQCWNPVLFQWNENTVWLFYKFGASIRNWKTMVISSTDSGKTWSEPRELIEGEASGGRGPVKNKAIRTKSGKILAQIQIDVQILDDFGKATLNNGQHAFIVLAFLGIVVTTV